MMKTVSFALIGFCATLLLTGTGHAEPMKCGGEEKTCQQACAKVPTATKSACLTECGVRKSACMRTGCWDNGQIRYCGLMKQ